jgi:hypothetical protein
VRQERRPDGLRNESFEEKFALMVQKKLDALEDRLENNGG